MQICEYRKPSSNKAGHMLWYTDFLFLSPRFSTWCRTYVMENTQRAPYTTQPATHRSPFPHGGRTTTKPPGLEASCLWAPRQLVVYFAWALVSRQQPIYVLETKIGVQMPWDLVLCFRKNGAALPGFGRMYQLQVHPLLL